MPATSAPCGWSNLCYYSPSSPNPTAVILTSICVFVLVGAYWLWHLAASPTSRRYGWHVLWRLACLIAAVRTSALWLGMATNFSSGWVQIPGYFLQMTALPEIYVLKFMRNSPFRWAIVATAVLVLSSFAWAALLVWIANRLRRETP
jgi:hypothetical protein